MIEETKKQVHRSSQKGPTIVGQYIRKRRETLGLSQRALGQLFQPPVTTQFVSNVERGVTPLPPAHVKTLSQALKMPENEIMDLLEREYAAKLSGRLGREDGSSDGRESQELKVDGTDLAFMRAVYEGYRNSNEAERKAFRTVCESMFQLPQEVDRAQSE